MTDKSSHRMFVGDQVVTLFECPDCGLVQSRCRQDWATRAQFRPAEAIWLCWDCGHEFGQLLDAGELDLTEALKDATP